MKNLLVISYAIAVLCLLNSCGVSFSSVSNHNQNNTQVSLQSNNYKIIGKATGSSEVSYVLIFGGMKEKQLFENAYSAMMDKANLTNGAKAVINVVTEEHIGGFPPFYYTRTITVSSNVIEFIK